MSGIKQIVRNQPFKATCPNCDKEQVITIGDARVDELLACDCGHRFDTSALIEAAAEEATRMKNAIRKAGYR